MSHLAFVYGVVTSAMAGPDDHQKYHRLNSIVIEHLPETDSYPPLSKSMFAITHDPSASWQTRAIHFGWTTRNFDCDAVTWVEKFEGLLTDLYWWEARVHMELEIYGKVEIHWEIDAKTVSSWQSNGLDVPNQWNRRIVADAGIRFSKSLGQTGAG